MIQIKSLTKTFFSEPVLDEVSLDVRTGEILFVIGKSGVGKSVLLKHITGLLRADSGEIWIDGQEVTKISEREYLEIRRRCGLVFQSPALLDFLTIQENIAFGLRAHRVYKKESETRERVREVLREVGLSASLLSLYPGSLSFGMQKRVSLARTLALSPHYLLYDEPTTGLDPIATRSINHLIRKLSSSQVTSIVVSHDMDSALEIADRIIMLDRGKVVAEGTPEEIRASGHPLVQSFLEASEVETAEGGTR